MNKRKLNQDEHKPRYSFRLKEDVTRNLCVYEIIREGDLPYTVIVQNFAEVGHRQLFNDIFFCDSWDPSRGQGDTVGYDIQFLINLWSQLELDKETGESLHPKHIIQDPLRFPFIYRRSMEDVMNRKYGSCNIDIIETVDEQQQSLSEPIVVPLTFDIKDTDTDIEEKIKNGLLSQIK